MLSEGHQETVRTYRTLLLEYALLLWRCCGHCVWHSPTGTVLLWCSVWETLPQVRALKVTLSQPPLTQCLPMHLPSSFSFFSTSLCSYVLYLLWPWNILAGKLALTQKYINKKTSCPFSPTPTSSPGYRRQGCCLPCSLLILSSSLGPEA